MLPVVYVVAMIIFGTLTDYKPEEKMSLKASKAITNQITKDSLNLYIWNIGYAGLGKESDFFLDGGQQTRVTEELTNKNLTGIKNTIAEWDDADFVLIQEVDEIAKRSYLVNQFTSIEESLPESWAGILAYNFIVKFVPVPMFKPLGKVKAGLATYTPYEATEMTRYQFPGNFSWPKRIFFLDRCFLVTRHTYKGKDLVVINTHNSAYDDGSLKQMQMQFLKEYISDEYEKGNYVIIGGDWNQCPYGYDCYSGQNKDIGIDQNHIEQDFMPDGWKWSYDESTRTNRKLSTSYVEGETFTTIIDFFLTSPNIEIIEVKGQELSFEYSDHQPVKLSIKLLE